MSQPSRLSTLCLSLCCFLCLSLASLGSLCSCPILPMLLPILPIRPSLCPSLPMPSLPRSPPLSRPYAPLSVNLLLGTMAGANSRRISPRKPAFGAARASAFNAHDAARVRPLFPPQKTAAPSPIPNNSALFLQKRHVALHKDWPIFAATFVIPRASSIRTSTALPRTLRWNTLRKEHELTGRVRARAHALSAA